MHRIPVYSPWRANNTSKYLQEVVQTNWFTSGGKFYDAATEKLKELLQAKHVLLTNSGTSACDLMVNVFTQLEPEISYFEVPDSVYAAAWNSLIRIPKLYFQTVDLSLNSWNAPLMTHKNGAVLNVHNLGNPNELIGVNTDFVLEDNCEGLFGSYYGGIPTGKRCRASACSFFGNKTVTCGEGGALVTDDTEFYELAKLIHGQGQGPKKFIHEKLGNNYRMTNTAAAILLSQLEALDDVLAMKEYLFDFYRKSLSAVDCKFQQVAGGCKSANWMFGVRFPKQKSYEEAESFFNALDIETRPMFYPAENQPYLTKIPNYLEIGTHSNAIEINQTTVVLPSYPDIAKVDIDRVVEATKRYADYLEGK